MYDSSSSTPEPALRIETEFYMRMLTHRLAAVALLLSILFHPLTGAFAADFKREVIYQIITDRFFDGNSANNNPSQSAGLYDSTKTNWRLYWGGDLQGIQQKMSYLAGMGVTAIWISPPVDNLNTNIPDGGETNRGTLRQQQQHLDGFRRHGFRCTLEWH